MYLKQSLSQQSLDSESIPVLTVAALPSLQKGTNNQEAVFPWIPLDKEEISHTFYRLYGRQEHDTFEIAS